MYDWVKPIVLTHLLISGQYATKFADAAIMCITNKNTKSTEKLPTAVTETQNCRRKQTRYCMLTLSAKLVDDEYVLNHNQLSDAWWQLKLKYFRVTPAEAIEISYKNAL